MSEAPTSETRLFLPLSLDHKDEDCGQTFDFLFDTGANLTCIRPHVASAAMRLGAVTGTAEPEYITTAAGGPMHPSKGLFIDWKLSDGTKFNSKCHVVPNLSQEAIMGNNIIKFLNLVADHENNQIIKDPLIVEGSALPATCMAVEDSETYFSPQMDLPQAGGQVIFGPWIDVLEEPLTDSDKIYTFHTLDNVKIPPRHQARIDVQAFKPNGDISRESQEYLMNIAPNGELVAQTFTDGTGFIIVENATNSHQEFPPQLPIAIGCTIQEYFTHRGFKESDQPAKYQPLHEVAECAKPSSSKQYPKLPRAPPKLTPDIQKLIDKQAKSVPGPARKRFRKILTKYHAIFARHKYDIGLIPNKSHKIELSDSTPAYTKQFPIPVAYQDAVSQHLSDLQRYGLVTRATSPYNAPIFCVPKGIAQKDKSIKIITPEGLRVVQDFRLLNSKTIPDKYSIQTVESCIASVGKLNSKFFSTIDLSSAFWQMALDKTSQKYTAFTVPGYGQFQWTRGAMGLTGCPASFARIMDEIMQDLKNVICYIDDILVHTNTLHGHLDQLEEVFARLALNNIKINVAKCSFLQPEVTYLGLEICAEGIKPGRVKAEVLAKAPTPNTAARLRSFIGLCSFFRSFVHNFSMKTNPLLDLLKKYPKWSASVRPLTTPELGAITYLKDTIAALPTLAFPRTDGQLHLYVDAALGDDSNAGGLGAALLQEQGPNKEKVPLGFASRRLRNAECRYTIFSLELQAAVYGIETFEHLLKGKHFHLYTDHKPLTHHTKLQAKTLSRLQEEIGKHNCTINYVEAKENVVADFLSRFSFKAEPLNMPVCNTSKPKKKTKDPFTPLHKEAALFAKHTIGKNNEVASLLSMSPVTDIIEAQAACPQAGPLLDAVEQGIHDYPSKPKKFALVIKGNLLHVLDKTEGPKPKSRLFIPTSMRRKYMLLAHKSVGHGGYDKTKHRIRPHAYWPDMDEDIRMFLQSCGPCAMKKGPNKREEGQIKTQIIPAENQPNGRVHMDLFGPLDVPGNSSGTRRTKQYVLVMTDALTKIVRLSIVKSKEADEVANTFLRDWCHIFGNPKTIVTDQGLEFTNQVMQSMLNDRGISHQTTTAYHPQANGQAEVFNRTMGRFLRATLMDTQTSHYQWPSLISLLQFTYNTSLHKTIKTTPFEVMFGYDPRVPGFQMEMDIEDLINKWELPPKRWESAKVNIQKTRETQNTKANKNRFVPDFHPGDQVLWINDRAHQANPKLQPKWAKATVSHPAWQPGNYYIKPASGKRKLVLVHAEKLKLDTTAEEKAQDPSFKPPGPAKPSRLPPRITRARARQAPRLNEVAAIKAYSAPPAGTTWTRRDLSHMFAAYAAHKLAPPEFETTLFQSNLPIQQLMAVVPQAQGVHQGIIPEPINQFNNMDNISNTDSFSDASVMSSEWDISSLHSLSSELFPADQTWENDSLNFSTQENVHEKSTLLSSSSEETLPPRPNFSPPPQSPLGHKSTDSQPNLGAIPKKRNPTKETTPSTPNAAATEKDKMGDKTSENTICPTFTPGEKLPEYTPPHITKRRPHILDQEVTKLMNFTLNDPNPGAIHHEHPKNLSGAQHAWRNTTSGARYLHLRTAPPPVVIPDHEELHTLSKDGLLQTAESMVEIWCPAHAHYAPSIRHAWELMEDGLAKAASEHEQRRILATFIRGTTNVINKAAQDSWKEELDELLANAVREAEVLYSKFY